MKWIFALLLVLSGLFAQSEEKIRFASIFSDNMVLQQQTSVNLWGYAKSKEKLALNCSWLNAGVSFESKADGTWMVSVKTPKGSFKSQSILLIGSKGEKVNLSNVLIGEVWLCSGQSNMEMILMNRTESNLVVENSEEEIANATNSNIRFVNIQRKESFTPLKEVLSFGWKICTPTDVKWLSAVAYFFGKKLTNELKVPVGLIVSAYGGSPIQSWIPEEVVNAKSLYEPEKVGRIAELKASTQSETEYIKAMSDWIATAEKKSATNLKDETQSLILPVNFEKSAVGNQLGEVLLSKEIEIKNKKPGQDMMVSLGTMDDLGRVYFNGELVWEEIRNSKSYQQIQFTVPSEKVNEGTNLIEVNVLNVLWGGGLTGPAEKMYYATGLNSEKVSLTGEWQFRKIFDLANANPLPCEGKPLFSTASSLYNGMIYPLVNYKIKGCLWYQGESNVGDEQRYPDMFTDLITSWRKDFGQDFPFYYVQIAPYKYGGIQDSKAAELREAQAKIEKTVPKTAMVVTIDVGNPVNIHPAKKLEVGQRLANLALTETYGNNIACKFPTVETVIRKGNTVVLTFLNVYQGLKSRGEQHEFELSSDGKKYYPASIKVLAKTIMASSPDVSSPRYLRYCWGDASAGTIFNSENLPLSSFRAEVAK